MSVTVVSAMYDIKSKRSFSHYLEWSKYFLQNTTCNMMIFTDEKSASHLKQYARDKRENIKIVIFPLEETHYYKLLDQKEWQYQHAIDPENSYHTIPLYILWNEKTKFVLRAIEENPFGSEKFLWCDIGFFRTEEFAKECRGFPFAAKIPHDKMLVLGIEPFQCYDSLTTFMTRSQPPNRLVGNCFGSGVEVWKKWDRYYDDMITLFRKEDKFIGKDQNIMACVYLLHSDLFSLPVVFDWFYLGKHLSQPSLGDLMTMYGSDKNTSHNYTHVYEELFKDLQDRKCNIFELGLGTNYLDIPSSMGSNGKPGASLFAWRDYFPHALVFGADIDRRILFQEERIKTYYCDQTNPEVIEQMWRSIEEKEKVKQFDLIIEDGLHEFHANVTFFENSKDRLSEGGYYVIEDVTTSTLPLWTYILKLWRLAYPEFEYEIRRIDYSRNRYDNNLIVAKRLPKKVLS
jgi:hypothetical protein